MSSDTPVFGWQGKANSNDYFGEYNQLLFMIRQVLSRVNVAALCEVLKVYGGGLGPVGFVDLQPLANQVDGYGNAIPQGVIHNIPYMRIQGGVNAIILDPQKGDIGVTVFADRDITAIKSTAKQANPNSNRRFDVADGLYLGGMLNGTPAQYIEFLTDSINIVSPNTVNIDGAVQVNINSPWINLSSWVGMLAPFSMSSIPNGWLACPTAQTLVGTTTYASLFNKIGYTWGGSGGSFGLPYFAAGYVPIAGTPGVLSHGNNIAHVHSLPTTLYAALYNQTNTGGAPSNTAGIGYNATQSEGGPDNLAAGMGVQWCVKY